MSNIPSRRKALGQLAAMTAVARIVMNLDEFVTRD